MPQATLRERTGIDASFGSSWVQQRALSGNAWGVCNASPGPAGSNAQVEAIFQPGRIQLATSNNRGRLLDFDACTERLINEISGLSLLVQDRSRFLYVDRTRVRSHQFPRRKGTFSPGLRVHFPD